MMVSFAVNLVYTGQGLIDNNKYSLEQCVIEICTITKLFEHLAQEKLLNLEADRQELSCRLGGLELLKDYYECAQYFSSCKLLPERAEKGGVGKLSYMKNGYTFRFVSLRLS